MRELCWSPMPLLRCHLFKISEITPVCIAEKNYFVVSKYFVRVLCISCQVNGCVTACVCDCVCACMFAP